MLATLRRRNELWMLPLLLLLGGCFTENDTITISKDGVLTFDSVVTIEDTAKKLQFDELDRLINQAVNELHEAHWKAARTWLSKDRPYKVQIAGSGKLDEVSPQTKFYVVRKVGAKQFAISFLAPGSGDATNRRRIEFKQAAGSAAVLDAKGNQVSSIDNASSKNTYMVNLL